MDDRTWNFSLSTSSSKYNQSYSDNLLEYEEFDGDTDEIEVDYPCPFCSEDFDIVGLCCHIEEEHYDESKRGVCPMCGTSVGADLVEHIAFQHENIYKSGSKTRHSHGDSQSTLALLRKEMLERSLKCLLGSSSPVISSSDAAVDQLLSSFVRSYSTTPEIESKPSCSSVDAPVKEEVVDEDTLERGMKKFVISEEKHEEHAQKCKFMQSLVFSTILDDDL
ncbi:protein DEHYDRATION-INDUCED 19 homolog 3-like [Chenopodium quinoa]|uniref:protein DEHYDRATION-INDUCED 19 homolog 3-like n=1 Tax=Chenopodium quinoa TaxID=63459 RepID=UPI000B781E07|nr:protein DEHYDRATION-INDUCED 19 homolog 3-like [Chenopodium quinoa]